MELRRIRTLCDGARPVASPARGSPAVLEDAEEAPSGSPLLLRVDGSSVALVHRGTSVVERRLEFPERVVHAVRARFPAKDEADEDAREKWCLCVLVRGDCVNIYTPSGEVFEVALPFQASRLFPMTDAQGRGAGLLLQRTALPVQLSTPAKRPSTAAAGATTGNSSSYSDHRYVPTSAPPLHTGDSAPAFADPLLARPRFFTLSHPLDEVKPIALGAESNSALPQFLSDPALEVVALLSELSALVTYNTEAQIFIVYRMAKIVCDAQHSNARAPRVDILDGPAWTAFRKHVEFQEQRIVIEPEWETHEIWRSKALSGYSIPLRSFPIASISSRRAFLVSHADGLQLLCMVDKLTGVLLLQPITLQTSKSTDDIEISFQAFDESNIIRCSDAVPINLSGHNQNASVPDGRLRSRDIIVLRLDGSLDLQRYTDVVCHIELTWGNNSRQSSLVFPKVVGLTSIDDGEAFETLLGPSKESCLVTKIWSWKHPLRGSYSPLVSLVLEVLELVLPRGICGRLHSEIVYQAQLKAKNGDFSSCSYEWKACATILTSIGGTDRSGSTDAGIARVETPSTPALSAFESLCQSEFHSSYQQKNSSMFHNMTWQSISTSSSPPTIRPYNEFFEHVMTIFGAIHLLREDLKLSQKATCFQQDLLEILLPMAGSLGLPLFSEYYWSESCLQARTLHTQEKSTGKFQVSKLFPWLLPGEPVPDILQWVLERIHTTSIGDRHTSEFPVLLTSNQLNPDLHEKLKLSNPLRRTQAICKVYSALVALDHDKMNSTGDDPAQHFVKMMDTLERELSNRSFTLEDLPVGVAYPIILAIQSVKQNPPPFIGERICSLIRRQDLLGAGASSALKTSRDKATPLSGTSHPIRLSRADGVGEGETLEVSDGLEDVVASSQPIFPRDQRVKEVARLLRSNRPICLKLEKGADTSDQDYVQQQQARLLLLCKRSMALSVARGMVTLGNFDVSLVQTQAWQLCIPSLPLAGRTPPTNAIVSLDVSGYAKELTFWPQFHNGCATGLRLPSTDLSRLINRHWIKYHRPTVSTDNNPLQQQRQSARTNNRPHLPPAEAKKQNLEEEFAAHAGLLLGIGLRGHLKCLSMADVYNYLSLSNEFITVAILLGMATTAAHSRRQRARESASTASSRANSTAPGVESPAIAIEEESSSQDIPAELDGDIPTLASRGVDSSKTGRNVQGGLSLELTLERSVSKMLCLHIPSLLPASFAEFSVPASTQTAALLGLGILYQATGYRLMAELLLAEISRSPSSSQFVSTSNTGNSGLSATAFDQLEGYSLAAGLALGLVLLGRGHETSGDPGLADLNLEERLHKYIVGGNQQQRDSNAAGSCLYRGRRWKAFGNGSEDGEFAAGRSGRASSLSRGHDIKYGSGDQTGSQAEHVNIGVTAPGSALALAFMYMQSGNKSVANQLAVPDTLILLDYVRPDILYVRTLARNLVLWNEIEPTEMWIEEHQVPAQLLRSYQQLYRRDRQIATPIKSPRGSENSTENTEELPTHTDVRSVCEAYANIAVGACASIGLRYAGTGNAEARLTLRSFVLHFRELRAKAPTSSIGLHSVGNSVIAAATERPTIERCLSTCALALAMVDAGSGNVDTLTLLRSLNVRQRVETDTTYGTHMALSMALGMLFLGGGRATLSRSKEAIAALVVAFYPMMPLNTADNKYHLQAFRHLYVLAVDTTRFVETIDATSLSSCSVAIQVELSDSGEVLSLSSPCLIPDLNEIKRITIASPDYYPVDIDLDGTNMGDRTANALRVQLLRLKSAIMLKRRKFAGNSGKVFANEQEMPFRYEKSDQDDRLVELLQLYIPSNAEIGGLDDSLREQDIQRRKWWAPYLRRTQLNWLRDDTQILLPMHFNMLLALFRLAHAPLMITMDLWNLRLMVDSKLMLQNAAKDEGVWHSERGVWLRHEIELALRQHWQRGGVSIGSLSCARAQLLEESSELLTPNGSFVVLRALVRYFAGQSWGTLASNWKPRLRRALASASVSLSGDAKAFELSSFLASEDYLSSAEKSFWLRLVSFLLFAA